MVNGAAPTRLTLEYLGASCMPEPQPPVPFFLNGVPIPTLPWGASCSCSPGAQSITTTDPTLLEALRQEGNYLSFATQQTNLEFVAWAVMTVEFSDGQRVERVALDFGAPGDAENRSPGDAGCADSTTLFTSMPITGLAFGGFPVEHCDGGTGCYGCSEPSCITVSSTQALAIPDFDTTNSVPGRAETFVQVPEVGPIRDVDVTVNLTHTYAGDLGVTIASPTLSVLLANRRGAAGDNFTGTQFDQACTTLIGDPTAVPPYTGCFRPDASLDTFNGQLSAGRWSLAATDNGTTDVGTIDGWTAKICGAP